DSPANTVYAVSLSLGTGALISFAELTLTGDSDVINPGNANHQSAEHGLDLAQALIVDMEPTFKETAEEQLFPQGAAATTEPTIQAVRDWVLFTKRREETCALEQPPPPVKPPRTYRVLNNTVTQDEVETEVQSLRALVSNAVGLKREIDALGLHENLII